MPKHNSNARTHALPPQRKQGECHSQPTIPTCLHHKPVATNQTLCAHAWCDQPNLGVPAAGLITALLPHVQRCSMGEGAGICKQQNETLTL
jgi:hypothetical protein